ncbi:LytTR family DNA-binding domain-containing protein [Mangrovimonas sp. ST2L15]|uniref:LytTR family DNA-binding domain-containing protein n=1 Tax=Mangrovimonas sp. ST2L15 TaxID=1645916 RepID=UPI0006B656E0|nr:LytTR family DNA-binding domain-containing protein [Mangrovimonas sp. ST2L15]
MKIYQFLNQPFHYFNTPTRKWAYIVASAIFAYLFLILFQPYGIHEEMENPINTPLSKFLFFLSIAFTAILGLSISQFLLRPALNFNDVTIKKYLFWFLFEAFLLTVISFGLSFIIPDLGNDFEQEMDVWFQLNNYFRALVILLFPFIGSIIFIVIKELKIEVNDLTSKMIAYQRKFKNTDESKMIEFKDENGQLEITIPLKQLIFLEANNQYVMIYFWKDSTVRKHIIRNRLKNLLAETKHLPIKQCHRSFAVNILQLEHVIRSNNKEFVLFKGNDELKVPLSKSFSEEMKQEILETNLR